jgi:hypothetical protein
MSRIPLILVFLLGLAAGLGGEYLLFLERQSSKVEEALRLDFKVLFFLSGVPELGRRKVIEEKLLALPDCEGVRYVSGQEAFLRLRREDPELVESVAPITENILPSAFEVSLGPAAFERLPQWISSAQSLAAWSDIRYKPAQARAILEAQFYGHFLNLGLSTLLCLAALMVLLGFFFGRGSSWSSVGIGLSAATGAIGGATLALGAAWPLRFLSPWWDWPSPGRQSILVLGVAAVGWVLCQSRD